jgi:DNA-binding NarL/FixJ family response regulator
MRVLLVDDHRVFLDSLRLVLTRECAMDVVGQAASAQEARRLARELEPDLLVLDLMLGDTDAVTLTRELRGGGLASKILILSVHQNSSFVRDALSSGVQGYALKEQPLREVVEAMRLVAGGGSYLAPGLDPLAVEKRKGRQTDRLSPREQEIFGLILQGHSSAEIATSLSISLKTVETHRANINRKRGVRSPAELIRLAAIQGLVVVPHARNRESS